MFGSFSLKMSHMYFLLIYFNLVEIKMRKRKQTLHVLKGHNVSLECSAVGYPLRVKWKKVIGGLEIDVGKFFVLWIEQ